VEVIEGSSRARIRDNNDSNKNVSNAYDKRRR
jgi:hypothetical protein